jgi:hypothetical protein
MVLRSGPHNRLVDGVVAMIQQNPAYHEGFYDAQFGEPIFDDCPSPEYRAGWAAYWECRNILAERTTNDRTIRPPSTSARANA